MPFQLILSLDDQQLRLPLVDGRNVLGSAVDCNLRCSFATLSRHHAALHSGADGVEVEDLESSNGTWLNDRRLRGRTAIAAGGVLRFGDVQAQLLRIDPSDASLAVPFHGQSPVEASLSPLDTMPALPPQAFSDAQLSGLLAALLAEEPLLTFAQRLGSSALDHLPIRDLELAAVTADGSETLLFRATERMDDAATRRQRHGLVAIGSPRGSRDIGPTLDCLLDWLALALKIRPDPALAAQDDEVSPIDDAPPLDPTMRDIQRRARQVAGSQINVLILGESGTGKEVLAQYIRRHAAGSDAPYVALNCAALADDLLDAELFGIERGVATGVDARPGKFEQAHGGILFLDEIGDMAAATQARILRVLQEREVVRIGGREPRPAEVRVIAASNQPIAEMVADGRFRRDLLHRIADWQVCLPPLRDRPADIVPLAARFLDAASRERGVQLRGITRAAADALLRYAWPGNVRELQREMARAAVFLGNGDALTRDDLQVLIQHATEVAGDDLKSQLEAAERSILQRALVRHDGKLSQAAETLGIARSTLYRRLAALGLSTPQEPPEEG